MTIDLTVFYSWYVKASFLTVMLVHFYYLPQFVFRKCGGLTKLTD